MYVCVFMRKRKLTLNKCIGMEMEELEFMHLDRKELTLQ